MRGKPGFSLVELLAVLSIILLLATFAVPVYANVTDRARQAKSKRDLEVIQDALEHYKAERGHYPDRLKRLVDLGYLKQSTTFRSPWWSDSNRVHYFYAVNRRGEDIATTYALGDPGDGARCNSPEKIPTSPHPELYKGSTGPIPCGRYSNEPAWVFNDSSDPTLDLCVPASQGPGTLGGAQRQPCRQTGWVRLEPGEMGSLAGFCCDDLIKEQ